MTRRLSILLVAYCGLWATASPDTATRPEPCRATTATLPDDATLAGAAGRYRLILVRTGPGTGLRSASGLLTLRASTPAMTMFGPASTPLYGATDIHLRAVGAHEIGDPAATGPDAPGVLVLESDRDGARRILLRLGADANRRDALLFDAGYTVLRVREIGAEGFAGTWESRARSAAVEGYFCATGEHPP